MTPPRRVQGLAGLQQAFDEVRFGPTRTLNLRASLPSAAEATTRVESWLRQHQMQRSDEVLVVTGRGNNSEGGISVVREASIRTFHALQKKGVIEGFVEHTAGSFVVTLAPVKAMHDAAARRAQPAPLPPLAAPPTLDALSAETRAALRVLAERSLDALGMRERGPFLEAEMLRLFGMLGAQMGEGNAADREGRLRAAIAGAMDEYD
ncbi:MAG: hypothetical protein JWL60_134 [Gemmatimonadetes bacterium]|jgi:hypothetical protein|nr:hypothetical protein [Gemmatimonadota bacterium]